MTYSILTAARNESAYIEKTLKSVIAQRHRPEEWIIADDGSTDGTGDLVERYAKQHSWIRLIRLRDFRPDLTSTGGRVGHILNLARRELRSGTDFITKLDADTEFADDFFTLLLMEFGKQPELGIASGQLIFEGKALRMEKGETKGAVMVIRKEVFDKVGGFLESKGRGEDTLFSVAARSFGWKTDNFNVPFNHLKPEGVRHSSFNQAFITGVYKGSIPYRLDFFLLTQARHIFRKPLLVGSVLQIAGYVRSRYLERYRPFPEYIARQLQKEQKAKMRGTKK